MARDKQLIVRVSEADREAFNNLCHSHDIGASTVLNTVIERVLSGALSLDILLGKSNQSINVDTITRDKLEMAIAELRQEFTEIIQAALSPLLERLEAPDPVVTDTVTPTTTTKPKERDMEEIKAAINGEGLTLSQLADYFGIPKNSISRTVQSGSQTFQNWLLGREENQDKELWTFEGEERSRRFYRIG
jgi:predicted XRE-type DNA-binding protein